MIRAVSEISKWLPDAGLSAVRLHAGVLSDAQRRMLIVKDANGVAVAYIYYEEEPGRRAAAKLMTKDEARRIAANIAKVPELLRQ